MRRAATRRRTASTVQWASTVWRARTTWTIVETVRSDDTLRRLRSPREGAMTAWLGGTLQRRAATRPRTASAVQLGNIASPGRRTASTATTLRSHLPFKTTPAHPAEAVEQPTAHTPRARLAITAMAPARAASMSSRRASVHHAPAAKVTARPQGVLRTFLVPRAPCRTWCRENATDAQQGK